MNASKLAICIAILMLGIIILFANSSSAQKQDYDVKITSKFGARGDPGYIVYHTYELENTGENRSQYYLEVNSEHNWDATFVNSVDYGLVGEDTITRLLESGETISVNIKVIIPHFNMKTYLEDGTWAWEDATLQLRAICYSADLIEDTNTTTTIVNLIHTVKLKAIPETLEIESVGVEDQKERRTAIYNINVTHVCNDLENETPKEIFISMYEPDGDWIPEGNKLNGTEVNLTFTLKVRESLNITLVVLAPVNVSIGECMIIVHANLTDDPTKYDTAITSTSVKPKPGVEIIEVIPETQFGAPEDILVYTFKIRNTGNTNDSYDLKISSEHGWKINATDFINDLGANLISIVNVTIRIPARSQMGTDNLWLNITSVSGQETVNDSKKAVTTVIQGYSVDLSPENITGKVKPGESITYLVNVTNMGNGNDTIKFEVEKYVYLNWTWNITLGSTGWGVTTPSSVHLNTGDTEIVEITISASKYASAHTNVTILLKGIPSDSKKSDTINITTTVEAIYGVSVETLEPEAGKGKPQDKILFNFKVTNLGNTYDQFILDATTEHNWTTHIFLNNVTENEINISRYGEKASDQRIDYKIIQVEVKIGDLLVGEEEVLTFQATSMTDGNATDSVKVIITVEQFYSVFLSATIRNDNKEQTGHKLILGGRTTYYVKVKNTGNGKDTFDLSVSVSNIIFGDDWSAFLNYHQVTLEADKSTFVMVEVEAPNNEQWGALSPSIIVTATSKGDDSVNSTTELPRSRIAYFDFTKSDDFHHIDHDTGYVCEITGYVYANDVIKYQFDIANANPNPQNFKITKPKSLEGWNYSLNEEIFMLSDYSKRTVTLTLNAPDTLSAPNLFKKKELPFDKIYINIEIDNETKNTIQITTKLLRLDLKVENLEITGKLIEGEIVKIETVIKADSEKVDIDLHDNITNIEVNVEINRKVINTTIIPYLIKGDSISFEFNWTVSDLDWKKKTDDLNITVSIGKYYIYNTTTPSNLDFETNNNIATYSHSVEDSPLIGTDKTLSVYVITIIILLIVIIIASIDLKLKKKKPFKIIGLSLMGFFISLLLAFILIIPWNDFIESYSNLIANLIIFISFYAIFPIMTLKYSVRARSYGVSMFVAIIPFIVFSIIVTIGNDFHQITEVLMDWVTMGAIVLCIMVGLISSIITYQAYNFAGQQILNMDEMCNRIRGDIYGPKTEKR